MKGPNREQWLVICGAFGAALFVYRDSLTQSNVATAFVAAAAALIVWRLSDRQSVPTIADLRDTAVAVGGVFVLLLVATLLVNKFSSSPYQAESPEPSYAGDGGQNAYVPPPASSGGGNSLVPDPSVSSPLPQGRPVTTLELLEAYRSNDFVMEQQYSRRAIEVTADVASVVPGRNEVGYLQLMVASNPNRTELMQALFQTKPDDINGLKPGDRVTLSCTPSYDADIDNVALNDCSVMK